MELQASRKILKKHLILVPKIRKCLFFFCVFFYIFHPP